MEGIRTVGKEEVYNRTKVVIAYLLYCGLLATLHAVYPTFTESMVDKFLSITSLIPAGYGIIKSLENMKK